METAQTMYLMATNGEPEVQWSEDGSFIWIDTPTFTRAEYHSLFYYGFRFGFHAPDYRVLMFHPKFQRDDASLMREIRPISDNDPDPVATRLRCLMVLAGLKEAFRRRQLGWSNKDKQPGTMMWFDQLGGPDVRIWFFDFLENMLFKDLEIDPNTL